MPSTPASPPPGIATGRPPTLAPQGMVYAPHALASAGGGRAAGRADLAWFRSRDLPQVPLTGILPATLSVPGAVAGTTGGDSPSRTP